MKSRARTAPIIGALLLAFLCCVIVAGLATVGLVARMRPMREPSYPSIAPEDLLLPEQALPGGWRASHVTSGRKEAEFFRYASIGVSREYGRGVLSEGSWVKHAVVWHRTEERARRTYTDRENPSFREHPPWEDLSAWAYTSPYADEQNLVCVTDGVSGKTVAYRCFFVARYGQYLSWLNIRVLPEHMNPDEVKEWIITVDELFADVE